jgi:hypothetical protein
MATLAFIAIYFALNIFLDPLLEKMVYKRLDSYINNTPNRLYDITYRNFEISIHDRAVRLGRINITPTKIATDSMMKNNLSMLISFEADSFYFDGLSIFKLLVLDNFKFEQIASRNPTVKIYLNPKAKVTPHKSSVATNIFSNKFKSGHINKFKIEDGNLYIINLPLKDSIFFKLNSSFLTIDNITIDPSEKNIIDRVKFKFMHFSSGALYGNFIDNYDVKADSIELNSKSRLLQINNFVIKPKNLSSTNNGVQFARDVISIKTDEIIFKGIDIQPNEVIQGLNSDKVSFTGLDFALSTDKRIPKNMNKKPLIGELISKVDIPFNINELKINNSKIQYTEIVDTDTKPLEVFFTDVNLTTTKITNDRNLQIDNPLLKINCTAKFLDAGSLDFNVDIPVTSKEDKMIVTGKLHQMTMQPVNRMLEEPLQVRFVSGQINTIDINFVADTKQAKGKLLFDYNDIKIQEFSDKKRKKNEIKERNKWFLNAIINGVVKKDNNKESEKFVTGIIDYERPGDIGIPGYLFRSVKSGLISTFKPGTRRKAIKEENKEKKEEKKEIKKNKKNSESKKRK